MKAKDIASSRNLDIEAFQAWIPVSGFNWKPTFRGAIDVLEEDIDAVVKKFKYDHSPEAAQAKAQLQQELAAMLITSGFSFDGFTVTKYSGYISGDDVTQIDRGTAGGWFGGGATNTGSALTNSLVVLRRNALMELKQAAHALGCNAVIGVDFDYITLEPETANRDGGTTYLPYVFAVTANGNAVTIEKNR
jgi:uncharacterized protein YbjQ (UPF0145 family)